MNSFRVRMYNFLTIGKAERSLLSHVVKSTSFACPLIVGLVVDNPTLACLWVTLPACL